MVTFLGFHSQLSQAQSWGESYNSHIKHAPSRSLPGTGYLLTWGDLNLGRERQQKVQEEIQRNGVWQQAEAASERIPECGLRWQGRELTENPCALRLGSYSDICDDSACGNRRLARRLDTIRTPHPESVCEVQSQFHSLLMHPPGGTR